jgi:predicted alpha/beta superfamily hydrolase
MKKFILLFLMTISFSGFGQKLKDSILSKKLDAYRHLTISLPPSYDREIKKVYPLLFLLDGDYLFDPFQGAISYGNYWDDLPEVIIVGLAQNRENERDSDCTFDESTGLPEGKGESFFEFIGGELMPFLQNKYRISPFKIIAGHDVTAGYMNLFLYKDNPLFNAYISLSPELATEMEVRVAERLGTFKQNMFYYQSSADGDIKKIRTKIATLDENIKAANNPNLNYKYDDFKGASHYSLVLYSIPSALYQFFAVYQPISTSEFQEKIVKLESGYVDYLKNKYEILEKALGIKMQIRLNDFKAIEAAILKNKAYNEFELLAQLSKKMYPKSMLGDYHMAMYYENTGDIKNAVRHYQNGFQMQEIGDLTKDMMLGKADELRVQIKKK